MRLNNRLYQSQKKFYRESYGSGVHGWPTFDPTPDVAVYINRVKKEFRNGKPSAIDIGCGEGRHSIYLAKKGFKTLGIDYISGAVQKAKKFGKEAKAKNITFRQMDFIKSETKPIYDLAIDSGVFHHILVTEQSEYLKHVYNTIKKYGYFIISTFSIKTKKHFNLKMKRNWMVHLGHYDRFFSIEELRSLLSRYFNVISIKREKRESAMLHALCKKVS